MDPHPVAHAPTTRSGWLEPDDPEWQRAWNYFPDPVLEHPESGECLEYMGSTQEPERGWVHVFRHRQMPTSHHRHYWRIKASAGWKPERQPQA